MKAFALRRGARKPFFRASFSASDPFVSIGTVAGLLPVAPRYLQKLFEGEGETFRVVCSIGVLPARIAPHPRYPTVVLKLNLGGVEAARRWPQYMFRSGHRHCGAMRAWCG
jgi:hypothetical protein